MSFQITYRRLFELQILHEFFLAEGPDDLFFSLSLQDRQARLEKKLLFNQYPLNNHLELLPTAECSAQLQKHKMKFVPTKLGGFVGIQVESGNNSLRPFITPSSTLSLDFVVRIKDPKIWTISQARFDMSSPAIYYLSNRNPNSNKAFPSLAESTDAFQAGYAYEMGELAMINNRVHTAKKDTNSNAAGDWIAVDVAGYVTEHDRFLLPKKFAYQFQDFVGINTATVKLEQGGVVIKEISFPQITRPELPLGLDFSTKPDPADNTRSLSIPNGVYDLAIDTNLGTLPLQKIHLHDTWSSGRNLGAIEFFLDAGDPNYALLAGGMVRDPHPVFELRLKNRLTHLRYTQKKPYTATEKTKVANYLDEITPEVLATKTPRSLITGATIFQAPSIQTIILPAPSLDFISKEFGAIYADIFVSTVNPLVKNS